MRERDSWGRLDPPQTAAGGRMLMGQGWPRSPKARSGLGRRSFARSTRYNQGVMTESAGVVLKDLRDGFGRIYGPRLKGVYLFGSYARGEQTLDSDLDVLIVLDAVERYGDELERTGELVSSLSLRAGVSISRVLVSERDWGGGDTPFLRHAKAEAIPA